ncbi:hypothetical protein [Desulfotomaculum copahuensis]|uniref:Uncharacterized protein n=1 Tax=Desulfotomaculum copahuensis TaxID=1838280 RepID=A0A1B7LFJ2_9FIRM|nr:hypothetical protein [Desulfotomaculum copahuensis]OAT82914.1 hypothetical protein A6M21_08435 [Desulfotomaculum copahuensis]
MTALRAPGETGAFFVRLPACPGNRANPGHPGIDTCHLVVFVLYFFWLVDKSFLFSIIYFWKLVIAFTITSIF